MLGAAEITNLKRRGSRRKKSINQYNRIAKDGEEESGTTTNDLEAPETSLKRQGSRRRGKKKNKGENEKTKLNRRRLSFGGMIGQALNTESEKADIEELANSILGDDEEKKEDKTKTPEKPKNKRKLSFKRLRRQESINPDENIEVQ